MLWYIGQMHMIKNIAGLVSINFKPFRENPSGSEMY
jgi:hypothetical protein